MILPDIPESIPRGAAMAVLRELGLDPKNLISLELRHDGIYAERFALTEDGRKMLDPQQDNVITHKVFIRFD